MHIEANSDDDRPEPAPRKREDASDTASGKPASAEGPFGKLRRWLGS
jgi:hypothetical protein